MRKVKQMGIIVFVVIIFLSAGVASILLGSRSMHTHYVCIEVNPRIEFLTDAKNNVSSFKPLNKEAKELCVLEEFKGIKIEDAVEKFLTLCAKSGYLKIDGEDNAVKLSVLAGLNQGLEVELTRKINSFFVKHEMLGVVIDSSQDLQNYKQAKKQGVSADKFDLMMAVKENNESENMKGLKKLSPLKLIKKIKQQHENYSFNYTEEELENKAKLIDFNRVSYNNHMAKITTETTRAFREKLQKHAKKYTKQYKLDFQNSYENWLYG